MPAPSEELPAWEPATRALRPGRLPTHDATSAAASGKLLGAASFFVATFACCIPGMLLAAVGLDAEALAFSAGLVGFAALLGVPAIALSRAYARNRRRRMAEQLAVEEGGISRMADGQRELVRWTDIASIKEHVLPGRLSFRDPSGRELFVIEHVTEGDKAMSHAVAAAVRDDRLPAAGVGTFHIGAGLGSAIGMLGGPVLLLVGAFRLAMAFFPGTPTLAELEHRVGRVARVGGIPADAPSSLQLELVDDDFAFYVVRGEQPSAQVLAAVHVGDEIEIWHDRSERRFGPIGAIHRLDVRGEHVFDAVADPAVRQAEMERALALAIGLVVLGALGYALGAWAQARRAVVVVRGPPA